MNSFGQRIWGFGVGVALCSLILGATGYFSNISPLYRGIILFLTHTILWYFLLFGGTRFTKGYIKLF